MKDIKTKFRPILFSTPMVQALLEGRKTMTRRTKGLEKINENPNELGKWKPSIFMPKQACRIFLRIKSIQVERLKDISREDARSEGIEIDLVSGTKYKNYIDGSTTYHEQTSFYSLWESINGIQSLENNPFVFVYEFEQIEKPLEFN